MLLSVDGYTSSEHPIIVHLIKGCIIFILQNPIRSFLSSLNMKQFTLKTVTLVALGSSQRSQTLAALDIGVMKSGEKGSEFIVKENLKPQSREKRLLCVHSNVSCYVAKTFNVR